MTQEIQESPTFAEALAAGDYHSGGRFEAVEVDDHRLEGHTFEGCVFVSCHFGEAPLAGVSFISTEFVRCEFLLTKLAGATLNGVTFRECKLVGLHFTECNRFGFQPAFEGCLIDQCVFQKNTWKKGRFTGSRLRQTDFLDCGLREACFDDTTFEEVRVDGCDLERADFRRAAGYALDPARNRLAKARFSLPEAESFLRFLGIRLD